MITMANNDRYREVYSTERGALCAACGNPRSACSCASERRALIRGDGDVKVRRETKGRGGKTVTTISGLALTKDELRKLLSDFKRLIGGGGTEKDGILELQGEHCDLVLHELGKRGIKAKRAGG
jgi:translation initiation factor 1